mmetsp:Transcript_120177/g.256461  ORF Transcript_120177/g.256461 Transcript_120177/m.256461 type:complete len:318 (+) Transcript_120177:68-1021(+)
MRRQAAGRLLVCFGAFGAPALSTGASAKQGGGPALYGRLSDEKLPNAGGPDEGLALDGSLIDEKVLQSLPIGGLLDERARFPSDNKSLQDKVATLELETARARQEVAGATLKGTRLRRMGSKLRHLVVADAGLGLGDGLADALPAAFPGSFSVPAVGLGAAIIAIGTLLLGLMCTGGTAVEYLGGTAAHESSTMQVLLAVVTTLLIVGVAAWQLLSRAGAGTMAGPQPLSTGVLLVGAVFIGLSCMLAMESAMQARHTLASTKQAIMNARLAVEEADATFDDLRDLGLETGNVKSARHGRDLLGPATQVETRTCPSW